VLAEPEMQELIAASPRARAILKPICNMLAIDPRVLTPARPTQPENPEIPPPAPAHPAPEGGESPHNAAHEPHHTPVKRPVPS
jgi:hypothetical protein